MTESSGNNFQVKVEFEDDRSMDTENSSNSKNLCVGIPTEPYVDYEKISAEIDDYKVPTWIRKTDENDRYRHVKCGGTGKGRSKLCDNCSKAKKTLDEFKQDALLHYCAGIPKEDVAEPTVDQPDLEDLGDRFRHTKCTRKMNDASSDICGMCADLKRRLGAAKRNRASPKIQKSTPKTNSRYLTPEERKERKQAAAKNSNSVKKPRRSRNSIAPSEDFPLYQPVYLHYVRMTMLLTYPHCEWADCQSPPFRFIMVTF